MKRLEKEYKGLTEAEALEIVNGLKGNDCILSKGKDFCKACGEMKGYYLYIDGLGNRGYTQALSVAFSIANNDFTLIQYR